MALSASALLQGHITKARRALRVREGTLPARGTGQGKGAHEAEGAAWTWGPLEGPRLLWVNEGKLLGRRLKGQIEARSQEARARGGGGTVTTRP